MTLRFCSRKSESMLLDFISNSRIFSIHHEFEAFKCNTLSVCPRRCCCWRNRVDRDSQWNVILMYRSVLMLFSIPQNMSRRDSSSSVGNPKLNRRFVYSFRRYEITALAGCTQEVQLSASLMRPSRAFVSLLSISHVPICRKMHLVRLQ